MVYEGIIRGKYVYLRSAAVEDAEFTLSLRQNPALTRFLPALNNTIDQQKEWIRNQRNKSGDYFFVARNYNDVPIGTVSIYNITEDSSESGRLALIGDPFENTEASLLLFRFAFNDLGLKKVTGYIIDGNKRADRFNKQFGCITKEPEKDEDGNLICKTMITDESFHRAEKKLTTLLYGTVKTD